MPTRSVAEAPAALLATPAARSTCPGSAALDQEHRAGSGHRHMVRTSFQQADSQFTFQPLPLLAQRRLDDVLPLRRPAEMQLLR